jgi:hypothetical protein
VLVRKMLYHLSHSAGPFCIGYFELGSCFILGLGMLFHIAGMTDACRCVVEMGSHEILPRLALNHESPDLCLIKKLELWA